MHRELISALMSVFISATAAHSQSAPQNSSHGRTVWTIAGAGAGFGVGLWAGLSAFDDAVNSDRKVWTSAIVGAAIGGLGGYFIGRARDRHDSAPVKSFGAPSVTPLRLEPRLLDELTRSVKLSGRLGGVSQ